MATYNNLFDSYQVYYYGGTSPSPAAVVLVYHTGALAGQMSFYASGPIPANTTVAPMGVAVPALNFALSSFDDIFEVLRYTKPLYLSLDTTTGNGYLTTGSLVPTGEEEGK